MKKFKKDMAVFGLSNHQNFLVYSRELEKHGYTVEDTKRYVNEEKKRIAKMQAGVVPVLKDCPSCKASMRLMSVNDSPGTMTGDPKDRSVWYCPNPDCMETIYSRKSVKELLKELEGGK